MTIEAEEFLTKRGIRFLKAPNGQIVVLNLDLTGDSFTRFPDMSKVVVRDEIRCYKCPNLISLEGMPPIAGRGYYLRECPKLTSLKGMPMDVERFSCVSCTGITSLKDGPASVRGWFSCVGCSITSLEGAPAFVGEGFDCFDNRKLVSLEGAPASVGTFFKCYYCPLESLEYAPKSFQELQSPFGTFGSPDKIPKHLLVSPVVRSIQRITTHGITRAIPSAKPLKLGRQP